MSKRFCNRACLLDAKIALDHRAQMERLRARLREADREDAWLFAKQMADD